MSVAVVTEEPHVLVHRSASLGRIRLNRPKALNSLTLDMIRRIDAALDRFEEDPDVAAVLVTGEGDRAFCAGGDIRAIYDSGRSGGDLAETFWREEYKLNSRIGRFAKPYVAIMDGIVMGGGVGISAHGSHRIVTERTRLAMPETGIGFFPDIGATWLLSRGPGEVGTFLGLTGELVGAGDTVAAGLADAFVPAADLAKLGAALGSLAPGSSGEQVSRVIARFSHEPPASALQSERARIDRIFACDSVEQVRARLAADGSEFARRTMETMAAKSPTSLKLTLRLLRLGRASSNLDECLAREFAATRQVLKSNDLLEGIRAAVIDKDRKPKWQPGSLIEVDERMLAAHFEPHPRPLFDQHDGQR